MSVGYFKCAGAIKRYYMNGFNFWTNNFIRHIGKKIKKIQENILREQERGLILMQ